MRGRWGWASIWIAATAIWLAAVVWPGAAGFGGAILHWHTAAAGLADHPIWQWKDVPGTILLTAEWSAAIAAGAVLVGIPAGLTLGLRWSPSCRRTTRRSTSHRWLAIAVIVTLCFPSYLTYWTWGLARAPDSALNNWAQSMSPRGSELLNTFQLWWGLVIWAWPIASLSLAGAAAAIPRERADLFLIDGVGLTRRLYLLLREARAGLILGFGLVFLATLAGHDAFDLASMQTYGNLLRRIAMETGGGSPSALLAASPMILISLIAAFAISEALAHPPSDDSDASNTSEEFTGPSSPRLRRPGLASTLAWIIIALSIGGPVILMLGRITDFSALRELWPIEGAGIIASLCTSAAAGAILALLALAFAGAWAQSSSAIRTLASLQALTWVWIGLTPAAAIGSMILTSYNHPWASSLIYSSPVIVVLGCVARYGLVAILIGRWIAVSEATSRAHLRRLDGADGLLPWLAAGGWNVIGPILAVAGLGATLALSEVATTMILSPPGFQSLAGRLLNKLHYAREDSALVTCLLLLVIVMAVGTPSAAALRALRRPRPTPNGPPRPSTPLVLFLAAATTLIATFATAGCNRSDSQSSAPFEPTLVFGSTGRALGQFVYPRGADVDESRHRLYVVDKSGRIQWFDTRDGKPVGSFILPKFDLGYPTGLSIHPDGRIFVADTHEHRILAFSPDGDLLQSFGSHGEGPGQFIYPTDVAFGPDDTIYVAEYGGNDRIQVFAPDGAFLFEFGEFGHQSDQFNRPQSIVYDSRRREFWIADACNHRLIRTDPRGQRLSTFGIPGRAPGQLSYPYGLVLLDDDSLVVSEFGNNRLQRFTRDGTSLGVIGELGADSGQLRFPWAVALNSSHLFIVDSGNNRIQVLPRP